jgi:hypothetical protein
MKARYLVLAAATLVMPVGAAISAGDVSGAGPHPAAAGCPDPGDTSEVNDGFPNRLSTLIGADIRTGGHECFERVVLELQGSGELPGYWVRYEADPILDSPRGEPVDVAGDATLVLSVGVWMTTIEGEGYQGPLSFVPDNVTNIRQLVMLENFEGQTAWAIGLDSQRPFTVSTLSDPVRIVIDIGVDQATPGPTTTGVPQPTSPSLPPTR